MNSTEVKIGTTLMELAVFPQLTLGTYWKMLAIKMLEVSPGHTWTDAQTGLGQ